MHLCISLPQELSQYYNSRPPFPGTSPRSGSSRNPLFSYGDRDRRPKRSGMDNENKNNDSEVDVEARL